MKNLLDFQITNHCQKYNKFINLVQVVNQELYFFFNLCGYAFYELTFVTSAEQMQKLNQKYRNKNYVTDVISICLWDDNDHPSVLIGEIFIHLPQIKKQAKKYHVPWQCEFIRMLIHSILHLFDFHHEESQWIDDYVESVQMKLTKKIFQKFTKRRKYE